MWTMPRISGRSSLTTTSRSLEPERAQRLALVLLAADPGPVWVTFSRPIRHRSRPHGPAAARPGRRPRAAGRGGPRPPRDARGRCSAATVACTMLIALSRAERLAQHVVDAGALQHGAHRTTGDDAGTGAGRTQQHDAGRRLTLHRVRDGALDARDLEEVLLGLLDTLGDRRGHLLGLAVADADRAVAVADDDQRGEAEAATTLDDLGDAVDRDDALDVRRSSPRRAATAAVAAVAAARCRRHRCRGAGAAPSRRDCPGIRRSFRFVDTSSELQPALAGGVGQRRDPAVVAVAAAVEHHGVDAGLLGALGDELADLACALAVLSPSSARTSASRSRPRPACGPRRRRRPGRRCAAADG